MPNSFTPNFESTNTLQNHLLKFDIASEKFNATRNNKFVGGVPLSFDGNKSVFVDPTDTHTLVLGATGSLKSRAVVMPTIKVLGSAGESLIINDPKGELYNRLGNELKNKRGYNVIVINLRNPSVGSAWNPLTIPYEFFINGDFDRAAEFANDIATNLMMSELSLDDPFWEFSSTDMCLGLILLLFKYCKENNLPKSAVNMANIIRLRQLLYSSDSINKRIWNYAKQDELILNCLSGSYKSASDTQKSIVCTFDQKVRSFSIQPTLLDMLSTNNFDASDIANKKTALFIITPDEKTTYSRLVSLFIKQIYEYIIFVAQENPDGKVKNRVNFIIDEFSSLPIISDMPAMIAAARSRDIRFMLVVQSKKQLVQRYKDEADTIISNCVNWIFLTSRELGLLQEISTLCGNQKNGQPNISVFDLQHLDKQKHEALVLSGRLRPAKVILADIDQYKRDDNGSPLPFETPPREQRTQIEFKFGEDSAEPKEKKSLFDDFDFDF